MEITYIDHSCFLIEGTKAIVLTDYWRDTYDGLVESTLLRKDKPIYMLVSHVHQDHFNPEIIFLHDTVHLIMSSDIRRRNKPLRDIAEISWMKRGDEFHDENISVIACGSTDVGVSFAIKMDNMTLFHAGDFNDWQRPDIQTEAESKQMHGYFVAELNKMKPIINNCNVAMFPVDPHIGEKFMDGVKLFCMCVKPKILIPMHTWDRFQEANAVAPLIESLGIGFVKLQKKGQHVYSFQ